MRAVRSPSRPWLGLVLFGFGSFLACSSDPSPGGGPEGSSGKAGSASGGSAGSAAGAAGQSAGGAAGAAGNGSAGTAGQSSAGSAGSDAAGGAGAGGTGTAGSAGSGAAGTGGSGAAGGGQGGSATAGSAGTTGGGVSGEAGGSSGGSGGATGGSGGDDYPGTIIVTDAFDAGESGAKPDAAKWAAYGEFEQGSPVLDSSRSHTPPNSVRATPSMGGGLGSFLVPASTLPNALPAPENRFYVRVWMSWEKASADVTGHGGFIVGASSRDNSGTEARLGISNPGFAPILDMNLQNPMDGGGGEVTRFSNGYTTGGNPGAYPQMGFQFEATRWYCVEVLFNGGGHEFRVWVDDVEVPNLHITDFGTNAPRTMWSPTYTFLKIGGQDYGSQLGSIWYDDVFVGTEPIGCERAVP